MKNKITSRFSLVELLLCTAIIGLFTFIALPQAHAGAGLDSFGITNSVAATSTNTGASTVGNAVKIDDYAEAGLYFRGALTNSGTSAVTFIVARSDESGVTETTPFFTWAITMNGTTPVVAHTNLPSTLIGSAIWLKVTSVGNANANPMTNAVFSVAKKKVPR